MLVGVVALLLMSVLSACRQPPTTLTTTTYLDGIYSPWDLGFTPDGTMLWTQRPGSLSALVGTEIHQLVWPADVYAKADMGMLGLAIDPDFATNRYVYTCFTSTVSGSLDERVVRWKVDAGYTTVTERTDIVTGIPAINLYLPDNGVHSGCRLQFGPDGYLWVTTGDAYSGTPPQDPASLGGKILRVDRNGAAAADNPGVTNAASPLDDRIYTYGHRNPQGIAFRPSDGQAFSVEHGTTADDEVNKLESGANYGWDPRPLDGSPGNDETNPMTDLVRHPNAKEAVWKSGSPTIAPSGATFLHGAQWAGWNGALAVACLKAQKLMVLYFNDDGTVTEWTAITGMGRLRTAVQGPDGALYIAVDSFTDGKILRVEATP